MSGYYYPYEGREGDYYDGYEADDAARCAALGELEEIQ